MGQKAIFDPVTKIIQITAAPVNGVVSIDVKVDLYSDMKEDWRNSSELTKYRIPIRAVGGDPLPGSKALGATFFLDSNWSIRPYNTDHRFIVNGNLYREDGTSPFINTVDVHNVLIESTVSSLVDSTVQQLQEIERSTFQDAAWVDVTSNNSGTAYPNGNVEYPVNNMTDAVAICTEKGFRVIQVVGNLTTNDINHDIRGLKLIGTSHVNSLLVVGSDTLCLTTAFEGFDVTGVLDGNSEINDCIVRDLEYFNGHIHNSGLAGVIEMNGVSNAVLDNCKTIDMNNTPVIDMINSTQNVAIPNYTGYLTVRNLVTNNKVGIALQGGHVVIESSCTAGVIQISGPGSVSDSSPNSCYVVDDTLRGSDVQNIARVVEMQRNHHTGIGIVWYWDPYNGNDFYDGRHSRRATKTFAKALDLASDNGHDIIMCVAGDPSGITVATEKIVMSKNYTFLRGPGRDFQIIPDDDTSATVIIDAVGVEVSGVVIDTAPTGTQNAIEVRDGSDFFNIENVWGGYSAGDAIRIDAPIGLKYGRISGCFFSHATSDGIHIKGNVRHTRIRDTELDAAGGHGIYIEGPGPARNNIIESSTKIYASGGYGVYLESDTKRNIIRSDTSLYDNTLGRIFDAGEDNQDEFTYGRLSDIYEELGLNKGNPMTLGNGKHLSNNIDITVTDNLDGTHTLSRE